MIIDEILDRKAGRPYNAKAFYNYCMDYFDGLGDMITRAMDGGTNGDVQEALCGYILQQDYNPDICDYIRSVDWLGGLEKLNSICWRCKRLGRAVDGCPGTTEQVWTGCVYREV